MTFIKRTWNVNAIDGKRTLGRGLLCRIYGRTWEKNNGGAHHILPTPQPVLSICAFQRQRGLQLDAKKKIFFFKAVIYYSGDRWRAVTVISIFAFGLARIEAFARAWFTHQQSAGGRAIRQLQVASAPATAPPHQSIHKKKGKAKPAPKGKSSALPFFFK